MFSKKHIYEFNGKRQEEKYLRLILTTASFIGFGPSVRFIQPCQTSWSPMVAKMKGGLRWYRERRRHFLVLSPISRRRRRIRERRYAKIGFTAMFPFLLLLLPSSLRLRYSVPPPPPSLRAHALLILSCHSFEAAHMRKKTNDQPRMHGLAPPAAKCRCWIAVRQTRELIHCQQEVDETTPPKMRPRRHKHIVLEYEEFVFDRCQRPIRSHSKDFMTCTLYIFPQFPPPFDREFPVAWNS